MIPLEATLRTHVSTTVAFATLILTACTGTVAPTDRSTPDVTPGADPSTDPGILPDGLQLPTTDLRRLTTRTYLTSLQAVLGDSIVDTGGAALARLPVDAGETFESQADPTASFAHVDAFLSVSESLANTAANDDAWLSDQASCLPSGLSDRTCVEEFARSIGRRAFRRPMQEADLDWLMAAYDDGVQISVRDGLRNLLVSVLNAPAFLYRLELEGEPYDEPNRTYHLTAHELATRLSYFAWGTPPDEELLASADSGGLLEDATFEQQLDRLLADPRAQARVASFFAEWLHYDRLGQPAQTDSFLDGIARVELVDEMQAEMDRFVVHHVFDDPATYAELHQTRIALPSATGAALYGVDESGETPVELSPQHAGILTRAALLYSPATQTSPVHRGLRVMESLLCQTVPPPTTASIPPDQIAPPPFSADKSARERWTEQTSTPACSGCHTRMNAFGFAFESYDTVGRFRVEEPVIDPDSGEEVNRLPIDDSVRVSLELGEDAVDLVGAVGIGSALADHPAARSCFADQWIRFTEGRDVVAADEQTANSIAERAEVGSLLDSFRTLALTPQFRLRRIAQ